MVSSFPKHLRVGTIKIPTEKDRYVMITRDGTTVYNAETSFVNFLSETLNFTYNFVIPDDLSFGYRLKNGSWTGLIGLVQRGDCDVSFDQMGLTEGRNQAADFAYPYHISPVTFLTHKPQPLAMSMAVVYPFSFNLWIALIVCVFAFSLFYSFMHYEDMKLVLTLFSVIGSIFEQPFSKRISTRKYPIPWLSWIIGTAFLIHSYKATLLSFLLITPTKGITTIAELSSAIVDGSAKAITYKGSFITSALLNSSDAAITLIGESMRKHSTEYIHPQDVMSWSDHSYSFIAAKIAFRHLESINFISKDSFFPMILAIPARKDFCCKKDLDNILQRMVTGGLYEKILKDIDNRFEIRNSLNLEKVDREHALSLSDMQDAMSMLIIGNILALLVFMAEILYYMKFRTKQIFERRKQPGTSKIKGHKK